VASSSAMEVSDRGNHKVMSSAAPAWAEYSSPTGLDKSMTKTSSVSALIAVVSANPLTLPEVKSLYSEMINAAAADRVWRPQQREPRRNAALKTKRLSSPDLNVSGECTSSDASANVEHGRDCFAPRG